MAIRASKLDAYRNLTEQVYGLYVNLRHKWATYLNQRKCSRRVKGLVYGSRLVSITPVGGETYETKLALEQEVIDELVSAYRKPTRQRNTETVTRVVPKPAPRQRRTDSSSNKRWFIKDAG